MNRRSVFAFLCALCAVTSVAGLRAGPPPSPGQSQLTFQARITQAGQPVSGVVSLTFMLADDPSPGQGQVFWSEPHDGGPGNAPPVMCSNGIFSVVLGSAVPFPPGALAPGGGDRYVAILLGASELARVKLTASAYAVVSTVSGAVWDPDNGVSLDLPLLDQRYFRRTNPDGSPAVVPLAGALQDAGTPYTLGDLDTRYAVGVSGPGGAVSDVANVVFVGAGVSVSANGASATVTIPGGGGTGTGPIDWNTIKAVFPGWSVMTFVDVTDETFLSTVSANNHVNLTPSTLWSFAHLSSGSGPRATYALNGDWTYSAPPAFTSRLISSTPTISTYILLEALVSGSTLTLEGSCDDFVRVFVDSQLKFAGTGAGVATRLGTTRGYQTTITALGQNRRLSVIFGFENNEDSLTTVNLRGTAPAFSIGSQVFEQPGIVFNGRPTAAP